MGSCYSQSYCRSGNCRTSHMKGCVSPHDTSCHIHSLFPSTKAQSPPSTLCAGSPRSQLVKPSARRSWECSSHSNVPSERWSLADSHNASSSKPHADKNKITLDYNSTDASCMISAAYSAWTARLFSVLSWFWCRAIFFHCSHTFPPHRSTITRCCSVCICCRRTLTAYCCLTTTCTCM